MEIGTENITTSLIRDTLGVSYNNVSSLCLSNRINRYSKRKPVRYEYSDPLYWFRANDGWFSLYVPLFNNTDTQEWDYDRPIGDYKMGHFRGYATNPSYPIVMIDKPSSITKTYTFIGIMPIGSDIQITLSDLDLRIGVELRHSNNDALIGWASGTLGSSSVTVDLNGVLNIDEIDVKFFLTDKTKGLWDSDVNEVRYSMPRGKVANEIPIIINRFWYNVTVVDDDLTPSPYFQIFTAAQTGALLNQIKIDYKPRGYVGTCEVTVRKKSNNQRLCDFQFEITDGWANGSYLYTLAGGEDFEEGVTYVAKARLPNYSQPLLVVGEDEFITFTTVP